MAEGGPSLQSLVGPPSPQTQGGGVHDGAQGETHVGGGHCWQLLLPGTDLSYRLPEAMIFIGREECDVTVRARSVDKRHAVIMFDYCDQRFKVKDLNSANGTFVNENRIPVQTYVQLDSMDMLRFGFDSAVYQVVQVPDSIPEEPTSFELLDAELEDTLSDEPSASVDLLVNISTEVSRSGPASPVDTHITSAESRQQERQHLIDSSRAASEEPSPRAVSTGTRHLSAPPVVTAEMTAATSNSSLHSAFSEDSLLGLDQAKPGGSPTTPSNRVPVDAVRTLGPHGPRVPSESIWSAHTASRRTNTAPARSSTPTRSSGRASSSSSTVTSSNRTTFTKSSTSSSDGNEAPTNAQHSSAPAEPVPDPSKNSCILPPPPLLQSPLTQTQQTSVQSPLVPPLTPHSPTVVLPPVNLSPTPVVLPPVVLPPPVAHQPTSPEVPTSSVATTPSLVPISTATPLVAPVVTPTVAPIVKPTVAPTPVAPTPVAPTPVASSSSSSPRDAPVPQRTSPIQEPENVLSPSSSSEEPSSSSSTSGPSANWLPPLPAPAQPPLHPMAFTVDFADDKKADSSKRLDIGTSISKFAPRHRRNLSVSREESKKQEKEPKSEPKEEVAPVKVSPIIKSPIVKSPIVKSPTAPCVPCVVASTNTANASTPRPLPQCAPSSLIAGAPLARRAGYHSEGYFSSDQEEDLSIKSDLSVRKAKGVDKGLRATNLAQEKKNKLEPSISENRAAVNKRLGGCGVGISERRAISLEESASQHFARILGEQGRASVPRQASCEPIPMEHSVESPIPDLEQDSPQDNVSEAGTYTIDKDSPSPEENKARSEIDIVFGVVEEETVVCDTRTFTRHKTSQEQINNSHEDLSHKVGSYRGGPNWIKEWAAQVAEQQSSASALVISESILPPIVSRGKGRGPSPSGINKAPSPLITPSGRPVPGWPPPPSEPPPPLSRSRQKLPSLSVNSPLTSDFSDNAESPVRRKVSVERSTEHASDAALETESYLRATESLVTAMQARMTQNHGPDMDSDGEGGASALVPEKSLTAQLRAKLRLLEQKSAKCAPAPQPPPVQQVVPRRQADKVRQREDSRQSDSSSEAGDHKPRSRERADSNSAGSGPPHTSLRRARLDAEEAEKNRVKVAAASKAPVRGTPSHPSAARGRRQEPVRTNSTSASKPPVPSATANFSRADGGRFSLRAGKVVNQPPPPAVPKAKPAPARKELSKKNSSSSSNNGGRSNSTLCSREVEFQNWKRRKSYDPMKAAAEGKKKAEAARKAVTNNINSCQNNIMTQSAIVMSSQASPNSSPLNSILRSASFHGTGAMAVGSTSSQGSATSEDEATLSADEELPEECHSPASPRHLRARPSPLPPHGSPMRAISQPPENNSLSRKSSLEETVNGSRGFIRNTTPTSSVRSRGKLEALDNLVIAAIHGFSNKIKGSSHNVLRKLRMLFREDQEKAALLEETLALLEEADPATSSPSKSPSKELSGTLRNLKKLEHVFAVMDEVLFGDEDDEEMELSDLEADQLVD